MQTTRSSWPIGYDGKPVPKDVLLDLFVSAAQDRRRLHAGGMVDVLTRAGVPVEYLGAASGVKPVTLRSWMYERRRFDRKTNH